MEIIQEAQRKSRTEYTREFKYSKDHNFGYSFPCDSKGNILSLRPASQENYDKIKLGQEDVIDEGVHISTSWWTEPAVGKCECGRKVELHDPLDNFCSCGQCYNSSGQRVTPSGECDEQGNPYDFDY
jgi:hypothetical protein